MHAISHCTSMYIQLTDVYMKPDINTTIFLQVFDSTAYVQISIVIYFYQIISLNMPAPCKINNLLFSDGQHICIFINGLELHNDIFHKIHPVLSRTNTAMISIVFLLPVNESRLARVSIIMYEYISRNGNVLPLMYSNYP